MAQVCQVVVPCEVWEAAVSHGRWLLVAGTADPLGEAFICSATILTGP